MKMPCKKSIEINELYNSISLSSFEDEETFLGFFPSVAYVVKNSQCVRIQRYFLLNTRYTVTPHKYKGISTKEKKAYAISRYIRIWRFCFWSILIFRPIISKTKPFRFAFNTLNININYKSAPSLVTASSSPRP